MVCCLFFLQAMLSPVMQACQVESDAAAVSAYIIFLAQHTSQFDIHDLDALALVRGMSSSLHLVCQ